MNYLTFVLKERRRLSFGLSFNFFSSFGQTFLISLFVPFFLREFQLSNAGFGSLYSIATLSGAIALPWLGKWIDHIPLRLYSTFVAGGLSIASLVLAISWNIGFLFAGLLLLRLTGQGLSTHTAQTAMAKFYDKERGKALSISSLGFPIGEAVLPIAITGLLAVIGWRMTWGAILLVIGFVLIPFIQLALRNEDTPAGKSSPAPQSRENAISYVSILRDYRFYFLVPAVLLPPFWGTGFFLYQVSVAESLGWTATLIASAFVLFAIARTISSLIIGPAIDRFSARSLFPWFILPMGIGFLIAVYHPGEWSAFVYMALIGVTLGMGSSIESALWAELYGRSSLGTVRSFFASLMVYSTAASPFIMGWFIDSGVSMPTILFWAFVTTVTGSLLSFGAFSSRIRLLFRNMMRS